MRRSPAAMQATPANAACGGGPLDSAKHERRMSRLSRVLFVLGCLAMVACLSLWVRGTIGRTADVWLHTSYRGTIYGDDHIRLGEGLIEIDYYRGDVSRYPKGPRYPNGWTASGLVEFQRKFPAGWIYRKWDLSGQVGSGLQLPYFTRCSGGSVITTSPDGEFHLRIPIWIPVSLCSIAPAIQVGAYCRKLRRTRRGLCADCGYDLRATPEPGGALLAACPECGPPTPAPARARVPRAA